MDSAVRRGSFHVFLISLHFIIFFSDLLIIEFYQLIISAKLIEIKSIVRTVMSSPISSSLLSPFLFIRYFFTITLCKTHAFLRYHCWGWGSHRVSQTTKCNQQRSHSLTEYNATVWRRPVVYWTEWCCLHKVLHIFVFTCKLKREISLKIIKYSIPTSINKIFPAFGENLVCWCLWTNSCCLLFHNTFTMIKTLANIYKWQENRTEKAKQHVVVLKI